MSRSFRDCVEHFPLSIFALVMGVAGLGLGLRTWGEHGGPAWLAEPVLMFAWMVFFLLGMLFIFKAVRYPAETIVDLRHPVRLNYLAAISISIVLMSMVLRPHEPLAAKGIFALGASFHLIMTILVVNFWMHHARFAITQVNPAWFIPAMGNVLIAIPAVAFDYEEVGWFFFSAGILFWAMLMNIVFYRILFHEPLPARVVPTLFILIAPPAVGFIAYVELTGELDSFARILFFIALFLTILLFTRVRGQAQIPFSLASWSYTFPLAAMSIALMDMAQLSGVAFYFWAGLALLFLVAFLVFVFLAMTVRAGFLGNFCRAEDP
jgi:tellurite resistance protein